MQQTVLDQLVGAGRAAMVARRFRAASLDHLVGAGEQNLVA